MRWLLLAIVLLSILLVWMFRGAGKWLIVEDPLQPAVAIVVLGGGLPFRAMEAADLYRSGYAPAIWIPGPEGAAEHEPIKKMGFSPDDPDVYYKVLEHLGVPRRSVRVLSPSLVKNTREEVVLISRALGEMGGGHVIIVTSPTHTRRVRTLWGRIAWPFDGLSVHYTRHEPHPAQLDGWWKKEGERRMVFRELGGLADAWLGFPTVVLRR